MNNHWSPPNSIKASESKKKSTCSRFGFWNISDFSYWNGKNLCFASSPMTVNLKSLGCGSSKTFEDLHVGSGNKFKPFSDIFLDQTTHQKENGPSAVGCQNQQIHRACHILFPKTPQHQNAVGWLPLGVQYNLTREADKKTLHSDLEGRTLRLNNWQDVGHITKPGSNQ